MRSTGFPSDDGNLGVSASDIDAERSMVHKFMRER